MPTVLQKTQIDSHSGILRAQFRHIFRRSLKPIEFYLVPEKAPIIVR